MLGYLYGKRFGSKIAWATRNEGDSVGAGINTPTFLEPSHSSYLPAYENGTPNKTTNSVALVRTRTIPTERPPSVGEVSANFCG